MQPIHVEHAEREESLEQMFDRLGLAAFHATDRMRRRCARYGYRIEQGDLTVSTFRRAAVGGRDSWISCLHWRPRSEKEQARLYADAARAESEATRRWVAEELERHRMLYAATITKRPWWRLWR
jgi:hypothetical protein